MSHLCQYIARSSNRIGLVIVLSLCCFYPASIRAAEFLDLEIGNSTYRIELARTSSERRQGLMGRRALDRDGGMLLVYRRPGYHRVWMKNMRIPLRVYWIDADFTVVGQQRLEPCERAPCPVYSVEKPSLFILELGDYENGLRVGDRLDGLRGLSR